MAIREREAAQAAAFGLTPLISAAAASFKQMAGQEEAMELAAELLFTIRLMSQEMNLTLMLTTFMPAVTAADQELYM